MTSKIDEYIKLAKEIIEREREEKWKLVLNNIKAFKLFISIFTSSNIKLIRKIAKLDYLPQHIVQKLIFECIDYKKAREYVVNRDVKGLLEYLAACAKACCYLYGDKFGISCKEEA